MPEKFAGPGGIRVCAADFAFSLSVSVCSPGTRFSCDVPSDYQYLRKLFCGAGFLACQQPGKAAPRDKFSGIDYMTTGAICQTVAVHPPACIKDRLNKQNCQLSSANAAGTCCACDSAGTCRRRQASSGVTVLMKMFDSSSKPATMERRGMISMCQWKSGS